MAIYDAYAVRSRVKVGVAVKEYQAKRIFELGLRFATAESRSVFEVGPGDGYIAGLARDAGLGYVAVEGSEAVADKLARAGHRVVRGYVPPLPEAIDAGQRCCFLLHVIEHMRSPAEAAALVEQLRSRLAPGGTLVVACPDYARWGHHFYDCDYTHAFPLTRRRLRQLLRDQGLDVLLETVYTGPVFGYGGLPLSWLAKALYWPLLDDLVGPHRFKDVANRGFLTLLPNLLAVARRPA